MNQGEGSVLEKKLESLGHEVVQSAEDADLVVLNTCTVILPTEKKMVKRMKEISKQGKHLIVSGCMAAVQPDQIKDAVPDALIIPPFEYDSFSPLVTDHFGVGTFTRMLEPDNVTAIVPIAQGCLGSCTYCITRMARGKLRSYSMESVIDSCRKSIDQGAKELLITAQDTACYGLDRGHNLGELVAAVSGISGRFRMRIGMMNPDSLHRIIETLVPAWESDKVYKFLHLPVQSGSNRIIKAMGRHYTVDDFKLHVEMFRNRFRNLTLSTDVITGFPGETDKDHKATTDLIKEVRPNIVNVTRYSPRPGTVAADAKNQVPGWVSKERSRELTQTRFKIGKSLNIGKEGDVEEVLVTERGKNDTYIGRTISYTPVVIEEGVRLGDFVDVEIVRSASTYVFGRLA
ncbi:MAG: tRNA (N(6)-L-threonylcarbamoyladenosine(37)-C(2))-methylthiotransferase [Methanomassiliicoccales archaeon]|nr:tRNA (N(6)-L-threonylcarbamoyladenosine(37)-C(2))-methylthiotransferase [Methanomassiliicoccales archaeon]